MTTYVWMAIIYPQIVSMCPYASYMPQLPYRVGVLPKEEVGQDVVPMELTKMQKICQISEAPNRRM